MKNLRAKLFIPTILMVLFCLGVILYISYRQYLSFVTIAAQTTRDIEENVQTRLLRIQTRNRSMVNVFTNNWRFIDDVTLNNTGKLLDWIVPFQVQGHLGIINVYNTTGDLLACAGNPGLFGTRDDISSLLAEMPTEADIFSVAAINNGKLTLISIKPIAGNYGPVGYLAVGQYLTLSTLSELRPTDHRNGMVLHFFYQDKEYLVWGGKNLPTSSKQKAITISFAKEVDGFGFLSVRLTEDISQSEKSFWCNLLVVILVFSFVSLIVIVFSRKITIEVIGELEKSRDELELRVQERTEALRGSEERFRTLIEQTPDAIFVCDMDGNLLLVNRQSCLSLGYSREELLNMTVSDVDPLYSEQEQPPLIWQKLTPEKSIAIESLHKRKDGSTFPVEIHISLIELGNTKAILGMVRDTSERKQAEAELKEYRGLLEEMVEKRTVELKEKSGKIEESRKALTYLVEDVNASREMLQKVNIDYAAANQELKEFAYIVSHDLKAPLRAISQLTHWISEDYAEVFDDDGRQQMALILKRVKRMDSLIDGVLRFSRIGRVKEKEEELDLNLLVKEVIENLAPPDNIQVALENKLPVVLRDPIRMGQVFQNLIGNAIKFMDKDEGIINVGCVDEGELWKFTVSDNGPGIDRRYHDKIFQIFQTLKARDEHESTGIGLTLVKKIITLYGGSIQVESEVGKGSAFIFTLPKK